MSLKVNLKLLIMEGNNYRDCFKQYGEWMQSKCTMFHGNNDNYDMMSMPCLTRPILLSLQPPRFEATVVEFFVNFCIYIPCMHCIA